MMPQARFKKLNPRFSSEWVFTECITTWDKNGAQHQTEPTNFKANIVVLIYFNRQLASLCLCNESVNAAHIAQKSLISPSTDPNLRVSAAKNPTNERVIF